MLTSLLSSNKLESPCSLAHDANLKFMCDICGFQTVNFSSLKSHLVEHNQAALGGSLNVMSHSLTSHEFHKATLMSHSVRSDPFKVGMNPTNAKLSSIIASTKNVSTSDTSKKNPFVINIPQTMKVFNVKEILSKLKTHENNDNNGFYAVATPTVVNSTNSTTFTLLSNRNEIKFEPLETSNAPNMSKTNIVKLEDVDKLDNEHHHLNQIILLNNSLNQQTPYHYSEYENVYICSLCNCTYDSLRSIKAHLWKHSGHHKFSYPIHDYNNRSK